MKLGLLVESEEGLDWERWRQTYRTAERLGFESLWLSDHLASPWAHDRYGLEPWIALSVAAAETQRLRLGPLVSPITFRAPAIVARMAVALADLSQDRFVLGLGLGWNADEHARFGIDFPQGEARGRLMADGLRLIREVLGERQVPLMIGGGGPRSTLPLVARWADEWNMTTSEPALYAQRAERLEQLCGQCGRDPRTIQRSIAAGVLIGRDAADLAERGARLARLVPPLATALASGDCVGAARSIGWVAGRPQDIVDQLQPFARGGVSVAILGNYDLEDVAALELIAHDVGPALA